MLENANPSEDYNQLCSEIAEKCNLNRFVCTKGKDKFINAGRGANWRSWRRFHIRHLWTTSILHHNPSSWLTYQNLHSHVFTHNIEKRQGINNHMWQDTIYNHSVPTTLIFGQEKLSLMEKGGRWYNKRGHIHSIQQEGKKKNMCYICRYVKQKLKFAKSSTNLPILKRNP